MIPPKPRYAREPDLSLGKAFSLWIEELPPRVMLVHLAAWIGLRIYLAAQGDWGWWDLAPLAAVVLIHPFVEWVIHVFVLHHRPRKVLGFKWDYHSARYHRLHHRDPWDLRWVVAPLSLVASGSIAGMIIYWPLAPSLGVWASAMIVTAALTTIYEWVHFLIHTSYRPKGRIYKRWWRLHRLHHYKNERYWMGVTRHFGDWVLGTLPDPSEVESSKTARTLGLDDEL